MVSQQYYGSCCSKLEPITSCQGPVPETLETVEDVSSDDNWIP